jgi:hypothetical protein
MAVLPNSMSFRLVSTRAVTDLAEIPDGFTGRVVVRDDHGPREVRWLDRGQLDDPADRSSVVGRLTEQESHGVGQDVDHGVDLLDRALR